MPSSGPRTELPVRRRRRKAGRITDMPEIGADSYEVVGPTPIPPQPLAPLALVRAQDTALRAAEEATYRVYRVPLFGARVELFRVVRDEDGNVSTFTINRED